MTGAVGVTLTGARAKAQDYCADATTVPAAGRRAAPLGTLNARADWGVAIGAPGLYDARMTDLIAAERPRFLAIANALKFDHLYAQEPVAGASLASVANFTECDDTLALAARLQVPVRGDCLAWNDWPPAWLTKLVDDGGTERARDLFRQHFEAVFAHFSARAGSADDPALISCGVVNEPFDPWSARGGVPGWRKGPWLSAFGPGPDGVPGYIHSAMAYANQFGTPRTLMFINETNCDNDRFGPMVRTAMLGLIDRMQRAGRRLDAIGLECHLMPQWMANPAAPDWKPFVAFLDEVGRRGVDVYLTELDVNDCSVRDARDRDRLVAETMGSFVSAALQSRAVKQVSNWDLSDTYSWWREAAVYRSMPKWADCVSSPPCPRPTPYDAAMQPKSARDALADALAGAR